jgi:hypothetical protein
MIKRGLGTHHQRAKRLRSFTLVQFVSIYQQFRRKNIFPCSWLFDIIHGANIYTGLDTTYKGSYDDAQD